MTQRQGHPGIERMCGLAGVSRASYYRHWQQSAPRQEETALRDEMQRLSLVHRHYGARRITVLLKRAGWAVNHKRIERLRREDNLLCIPQRKFAVTTDSRHAFRRYPNLARTLVVTAVNQLWVADITYVRLLEELVYLAVVLDAFSRRAIGWHMASHLQAGRALVALDMALCTREVVAGELIHHSDRGIQYACTEYVARLEQVGIVPSMSRPACPWDNAMAESFVRTLKKQEVNGQRYRDLAEARTSIERFIADIYNSERLHSALGYLSPEDFESGLSVAALCV
jgi:putative transposase